MSKELLDKLKEKLDFEGRSDLTHLLNLAGYNAYEAGYKDGFQCFAWWRDGEQMVGTCGKTLKTALQEYHSFHNYNPEMVNLCLPREGYKR